MTMMHRLFARSLFALALGLASLSALPAAPALPAGVSLGSTVEGITEYRLANGLQVLLFPDPSKPTATVNVTYLVGSRHEGYGETGMAHLLEHLAFKGSKKFLNITQGFSQRGMRFNGSTWLDRTNYFESFQASDDNLKWALDMEADRMVNAFIARKDLDTEMTVVRNEFERGENSPQRVLHKRLQSVAFDWHNYGHSTIGNRSDIENVRIDNLQAFYRRYYQPDNAVLVVSGQFDVEKTLGWINQSFGRIPKPSRELPVFWTTEPTQDGERSVTVRRKGDVQLVQVAYKLPSDIHPDAAASEYLANILTDTPNGRLYKQFVQTGKATQVYADTVGGVAPGLLIIGLEVKKGEPLEPVRDALIAAIESAAQTPPSDEEMERTRRDLANAQEKLVNDPERMSIELSEYIALGDWRFFFYNRARQEKVTPQQVIAVAQTYLRRDNRTVGLFVPEDAPQRADIPPAASMTDTLRDFQPPAPRAAAEVFEPSPRHIDARTEQSQLGGLALALLPRKTRGESVSVALRLHWGDAQSLSGQKWVAELSKRLLSTGTSRYSRAQLADEMAKLKMSGSLLQFDTTRPHLDAALTLVAHVLREASFPESEFTQVRKQLQVALESQRNEPGARASEALALHFDRYPKNDIRAAQTLDDSLQALGALSLEQVKAFHRNFYGASKGELSIVGDFDAASAKARITQAFAGWTSQRPYARLVESYNDIPATRQVLDTPDKESGVVQARINLALSQTDPDYPALVVANYLFGGASLNSRLMQRIRQKDGLSYGAGSRLNAGLIDRAGSLDISATAAPQNLLKVEAAVREELQRALSQGFSADEVREAQSGLAQQRLQARTEDAALASAWATHRYLQRSFAWDQALDEAIAALTPEQVNAAWARQVKAERLSMVLARDPVRAAAGGR